MYGYQRIIFSRASCTYLDRFSFQRHANNKKILKESGRSIKLRVDVNINIL